MSANPLPGLFSGGAGVKATCNDQPIRCLEERLNENSQLAVSGNILSYLPHCGAELMGKYNYMNLGSAALHFGYVARGGFTASILGKVVAVLRRV